MHTRIQACGRPNDLATPFMLAAVGVGVALSVFASGCSGGRAAAVDAPGARAALRATLESWKNGDPSGTLRGRRPAIVVQDIDWEAGQSLVDYRILGDGRDDDANLRIPVELRLRGKAGKEARKRVHYVVGTSPVITVFRELF